MVSEAGARSFPASLLFGDQPVYYICLVRTGTPGQIGSVWRGFFPKAPLDRSTRAAFTLSVRWMRPEKGVPLICASDE